MPPPPGPESGGCLRTALVHVLLLGFFGVFWVAILGPEVLGQLFLAYVAGLSGLAFLRVFGRVDKK